MPEFLIILGIHKFRQALKNYYYSISHFLETLFLILQEENLLYVALSKFQGKFRLKEKKESCNTCYLLKLRVCLRRESNPHSHYLRITISLISLGLRASLLSPLWQVRCLCNHTVLSYLKLAHHYVTVSVLRCLSIQLLRHIS